MEVFHLLKTTGELPFLLSFLRSLTIVFSSCLEISFPMMHSSLVFRQVVLQYNALGQYRRLFPTTYRVAQKFFVVYLISQKHLTR